MAATVRAGTVLRGETTAGAAIARAASRDETKALGRGTAGFPWSRLVPCLGVVFAAGSLLASAAPKAPGPIAVRASRSGFSPASISLRRGEAVRLELTTADAEHCFAVDALRIEKRIVPGKTTTLDLTPDRVGTFAYYCCLESGAAADKQRGKLIVTE